ncbi:MAG TPA: hypothetical protein PLC12_04510 [Candidatus Methanofastidiosa archaeon]|nr:hypothetical protein [Candidatus Methanofastidiosa archaeon]
MGLQAAAEDFALELEVVDVDPVSISVGDTVTLVVEVTNVSTDTTEKLWDAVMFIDQELIDQTLLSHMTINEPDGAPVLYEGNDHIDSYLRPGETATATLTFTLDNELAGGNYQIPLVLTGKRGPCSQGCSPWREDPIYFSINVIHGIPALSISFSDNNIATEGDTLMLGFTLKNLGSDDAMEMEASIASEYPSFVGQVNLSETVSTLGPNETLTGTIAVFTSAIGVGEFEIQLFINYSDRNGKVYEQSKTVSFKVLESSELTYEEMGDASYASAVEYYSSKDYKSAILDFALAKELYDMAGVDDKSEECSQYLDTIYSELVVSLTPDPVVETIGKNHYLVVGLGVGFIVTLIGLLAGFARVKKKK